MKYLFSKAVAKCLVQMQQLHIRDCAVMEAVIMNEGTSVGDDDIISFSKLKSLRLSDLPTLKSFYLEKEQTSTSTLSMVDNSGIPSVQSKPLFDGMVAFPVLEELSIKKLDCTTKDIWGNYYSDSVSSSFCKLKKLDVSCCNKLETVIPLAMTNRLRSLESLEISFCKSLQNTFQNSSVARDLIHLKTMRIVWCEMIREIIGGEEITDDGIIVFPELTYLCLSELQNLTNFWCDHSGGAKSFKVQFPNLIDIFLKGCGQINLEATELGTDDSNCQLKSLEMSYNANVQLPCEWQLRLHNLESLTLIGYYGWRELKFQCFRSLKKLKVQNSRCSTLLSFRNFESLPQLQELEISDCHLLEEIVDIVRGDETSGMDKKTITLPQLQKVTLRDCPNLKTFIHRTNYEGQMPALRKVEVIKYGFST